jgi:hypothetical protein
MDPIFAFTLKRRLLLLCYEFSSRFAPSPHHTIVKRFPSFVHIRITVMTGRASPCMHNLVTWILFYDGASNDCYYLYSYTSCECCCHSISQGKERLSGVPPAPIRKITAFGNLLSIHTVHAIPSEGPMTGSVISVSRSRCAHDPRTRLHTFLCLRGVPKCLPRRRSASRHVPHFA